MSVNVEHNRVLRAAIAGDDRALSELVRAYHDRVYRFGVRVCRDQFDAEDAVQAAFIALARRPDVQSDPGVLSWLMTSVRRVCLSFFRALTREQARLGERGSAEEIASDALSPEAALERFRLVEAVHAAIARVPQADREVLILRDIEGASGEEVCALLGISLAAMKSRLHRARSAVRDELRVAGVVQENFGKT